MWFNNPPKRLCQICLLSPRYELVFLSKAAKHFRFTKAETKNVAAIKCPPLCIPQLKVLVSSHGANMPFPLGFPVGSIVTHRSVVEKLAVTLGKEKSRELAHSKKIPFIWLETNLGLPGTLQTPSVLRVHLYLSQSSQHETDVTASTTELCNMHGTRIHPEPHEIRLPLPQSKLIAQIPHTYEALREHVSKVHPEKLAPFEKGWNMLDHDRQYQWLAEGQEPEFLVTRWGSWEAVVFRLEGRFRSHSPLWDIHER